MGELRQIVGIVLVKNEDRFVGRAVRNIAAFCDSMLLCDNGSCDSTLGILKELADEFSHAELHSISHPSVSHDLLKRFAATPTWVFAVDGDEIYDPVRLAGFRVRVLSGEFDGLWRIKGNVLHCTWLSEDGVRARGYLATPSRSITKLYNFGVIQSWDGDTVERLHGGKVVFQSGFDDLKKLNFQESISWDETPLRCLHTCFLRRSSLDEDGGVRENIMEVYRGGITGTLRRIGNRLRGRVTESKWKKHHYRQGDEVMLDTSVFFSGSGSFE